MGSPGAHFGSKLGSTKGLTTYFMSFDGFVLVLFDGHDNKIILKYNIFIAPYSQSALWCCTSHVSRIIKIYLFR